MDHEESGESDDGAAQSEVAENPSLRGNSTEATPNSIDMMMGGNDPGVAPSGADGSTGVDAADVGGAVVDASQPGMAATTTVEPPVAAPSMTTMAATSAANTTDHTGDAVGGSHNTMGQPAPLDGPENKDPIREDPPVSDGPQGEPDGGAGETAKAAEATGTAPDDSLTPQQSPSKPLGALLSDQSSLGQDQTMSMDEDDTDIHSDRASSFDAQHSESDADPAYMAPRVGDSDRAPLEDAYGPYIRPSDTCLNDARERLYVALEQTRLLRESFTAQAYGRYRCVLKPVPESLNEITTRIHSDPIDAGEVLREQSEAIRLEKQMEKRQAKQAGVGLEEVAYFAEGLHLVVLPEDEVDETDIDFEQYPDRGPTNLVTGERTDEISPAAAASTDLVFDRIRRSRAIRMGADIAPAPVPDTVIQMSRNIAQDPHSDVGAAAHAPSPAPSSDSDASDNKQRAEKDPLQHLLSLVPGAEGFRTDGSFTAVQSALIAAGVGMNESCRDLRLDPLRQRMFQPNFFAPTPAYKLLPPLLDPKQLHRLKAADARKEGDEDKTGARKSIQSVVEEICSSVNNKGKCLVNGSSGGGSSSSSTWEALGDEHGASELSMLQRMWLKNFADQKDINHAETGDGVAPQPSAESVCPDTETAGIDPLLSFSVMNAVGLVGNKKGNGKKPPPPASSSKTTSSEYAQVLGLERLTGLESVSTFFNANPSSGVGKKRRLSETDSVMSNAGGKANADDASMAENGDLNEDVVYQIRGGGEVDSIDPKETGEPKKKKTRVAQGKSKTVPVPTHAGYTGYGPLYNGGQVAAAASQQLLQQQLGSHTGPYNAAALGHQQSTIPADLSEFYLRNGLAALQTAPPSAQNTIGLLRGQLNFGLSEQDAARTILLRDRHNAAARAQEAAATAAAAACYQAALSSINPRNPFGFVASDPQSISSLPAILAMQQKATTAKKFQRKRSSSLSENVTSEKGGKAVSGSDAGITDQVDDVKRPASAPPSPANFEINNVAKPSCEMRTKVSSTRTVPCEGELHSERRFPVPPIPEGLRHDIANLIADARFHEARTKSDESEEALLVKFLLSLSGAIPIPNNLILDPLMERLSSPNYHLRLHEFVGSSSTASTSRNVIIAIISIWLWNEHEDCFKPELVDGAEEYSLRYKWLINLAVDKCLSALATFFDSHPAGKGHGPKETPDEQVATIASQSLSKQIFVDRGADATFPIFEDLLKLLDSLRQDALRSKTQERVLLATLASRCGNMSEAFANPYVSSIVRAGEALGHENVCEIGQNEECRASTMIPYDFFHDNVGIWEEPCRPVTGYHHAVGGDELKKQAHARSVIQKSLKMLQSQHGLKGGIVDGGPYSATPTVASSKPTKAAKTSAPLTTLPPLVVTSNGSLSRRNSIEGPDFAVTTGPADLFDPDHSIGPVYWQPKDIESLPYGHSQPGDSIAMRETKKRKLSPLVEETPSDEAAALTHENRSTYEVEWDDVANMFFHGGSTRSIDIDDDFDIVELGKKNIFAPFVQPYDPTSVDDEAETSDEDICDETVLKRHQEVLTEMKLKLDAALESKKLNAPPQPPVRGRKK